MTSENDAIKQAIHASIAKTILEGLGTESRDALIVEAMERTLKDYKFTSAINEVVAKRAMEVATELVKADLWTQRIQAAIQLGFEDYLVNLRAAMPDVLRQSLHGTDNDTFSRGPAAILRCWPKPPLVPKSAKGGY